MAAGLKQFLYEIDKESDELSNGTIQQEYGFLLNYSLLYPWLKPFHYGMVRLLHLFIHHIYHISMFGCCIMTAYLGSDDFIVAGSLTNYGLITITFELILFQINLQRKNMARVHRIIGQGVYDYNENTPVVIEEIAIKAKYQSLIRWARIIVLTMPMFGGCVLLLFGPLIDSIAGVEKQVVHSDNGVNYDLPVPLWVPFDSTGPFTYWLTIVYHVISVITSISIFISFNIVYFTVCMHVACHLEILILSVKNIELRAKILFQQKYNLSVENEFHIEDLYKDKDFIRCLEDCFKKNIQHHQVILRLHRASTEIFRHPIFTFYFLVGFMIALASYAAISVTGQPGGVINFVDIAVVQLSIVALTCLMGQNLTDLNTKFRMELYSINWYRHVRTITNLLTIVLEFSYRDLVIEAPFNFAANIKTLAGVSNEYSLHMNKVIFKHEYFLQFIFGPYMKSAIL